MTSAEYDKRLHLMLGVSGPMAPYVVDGVTMLVYRLPDGSSKDLPCPQDMTPAQREATLADLARHLTTIADRRQKNGRSPV